MEEIERILRSNPYWEKLMDEYQEPYTLEYNYRGMKFFVFNQVGGSIYIGISPESIELAYEHRTDARRFADVATAFFSGLKD